nr:GPCR kinase [Tanacetum cinerariifolium]
MRNVVKVFHKDTVLGSGSGVGGSGMLDKEEIIKLLEEEEMAELELQVCGNFTNQEDQYKLDDEALNLTLEEEARATRAEQEWLDKCRQEQELDGEHERQLLGLYLALKPSTHSVITIFMYPLRDEVEAACALEVEVEATCRVGALDLRGLSLNIIISASVSGYLVSFNKTRSSLLKTPSSLETSSSLDN